MRSKLSLFLASIMMLTLFAFIGCGDDEPGTTNFDTQQEAMDEWNSGALGSGNQMDYAYQLALLAVEMANDFSGDFDDLGDVFLLKKNGFHKPDASMANGYQGNGLWTYDTTFTDSDELTVGTYTYHVALTLLDHFTEQGLPTSQTDGANLEGNFVWELDYLTTSDASFSYDFNVGVTGLSGFRAATGNATLNGDLIFLITSTSTGQGENYSFEYRYNISFDNLVVAPDDSYPLESGSINFTSKLSIDPNVQGFEEFNVKGKITFDGDNTAILEFGGFTFTLNLDTGDITPV